MSAHCDHILFDWGDTVMNDDPTRTDAMYLWPQVELVEGAAEVLRVLASSHQLGIATSAVGSDATKVRKALARVGVDRYIKVVFTAFTTGFAKTDARFWQCVLRELDAPAERVLMVGDGFEGDVLVPSGLGLQAVWFNPRTAETRCGKNYRTIHRLTELIT